MSVSSNILTVIEPRLVLDEVQIKNFSEDEGAGPSQIPSKRVGDLRPMVTINGYSITNADLLNFELELTGDLPRLYVVFQDSLNLFTIDNYPKDGALINVRIASKNATTYKSIRMDFDILDVYSDPVFGDMSIPIYRINGICSIPGLFSEDCKSFGEGTSLDHLEAMATDLKIGLATNITAPKDLMKRILPYSSRIDFIKDTVDSSYIGEESFQTFHIDQYYYLNFVDVNAQFNIKADFEDAYTTFLQDVSTDIKNSGVDEMLGKLMLTNNLNLKGMSNHIETYTLLNNAAKIVARQGYSRSVQYYDEGDQEKKLREFKIESMTSKDMKPIESPLKGRYGSSGKAVYELERKHKFLGRQFYSDDAKSKNNHLNYNYGIVQNIINMAELEKLQLVVELGTNDNAFYRFQKVPVIIYEHSAQKKGMVDLKEERLKEVGMPEGHFDGAKQEPALNSIEGGESTGIPKINELLSGNYLVGSIIYRYTKEEGMKQRLHLLRREWPVSLNQLPITKKE
jgi:hypothetical protein